MAGAGYPGYPVTRDDLHKAAWSLYTGSGEHAIPPGTPRPFVFSADEIPGRPGLFLFKIRSAQAFPKAKSLSFDANEGESMKLAFRFQPVARRGNRRGTIDETEWQDFAEHLLRKAGIEAVDTTLTLEGHRRNSMREGPLATPTVFCEVEGVVADGLSLADYWTRGLGRGRAYGFGLLQAA